MLPCMAILDYMFIRDSGVRDHYDQNEQHDHHGLNDHQDQSDRGTRKFSLCLNSKGLREKSYDVKSKTQ